jgi:lipid-binding SYLF domain-containing protein
MVSRPNGRQEGWGAINTGSLGLQAGVRGFKMLMVIQDEATLNRLKQNKLTGSVSGVVVVAETGTSATAPFENGVAVYQGASAGLMAGVNFGLEYLRYKSIDEDR